jgi:hypothetical protein
MLLIDNKVLSMTEKEILDIMNQDFKDIKVKKSKIEKKLTK